MMIKNVYLSVCTLLIITFTSFSFAQERIVYLTNRPANWDIYLFESPGSQPRRLTDDPALDYNAVFSPDGRWVVFCSERRGNPDLYALDLKNGGPPRLLTDNEALDDAPAFSPDGRWLAFVSTRDGDADIFLMGFNPDDPKPAKAINLTRSPGGDFQPSFSPDGRRIVFSSDRAHPDLRVAFNSANRLNATDVSSFTSIYVMNLDGSDQKRLTSTNSIDGSPAWSADGTSIYFYSNRGGAKTFRIWRMNSDGSDPQPISAAERTALSPAITREGRVAFSSRADKRWQIVSVAPDGGDQRIETDTKNQYWAPDFDRKTGRMVCHGTGPFENAPLGQSSAGPVPFLVWEQRTEKRLPGHAVTLFAAREAVFPSFNPDGTEIVTGWNVLMISRPDGSNPRTVYESKIGPAWAPNWSKDGQWIAFNIGPRFAGPEGACDVWKVRPDGSGAVNLTADSKANDAFPCFSPDGKWIVFRSGRDGNQEIYLMDADGKHARRLTDNKATDTMPFFSPKGNQIAFSSDRDGSFQIYTLDLSPDGAPGALRRITDAPGFNMHPRYSPDGEWIIFSSGRGGFTDESPLSQELIFNAQPYGELYALRLKDGLTVRLTHNKWEDGLAAWSRQ